MKITMQAENDCPDQTPRVVDVELVKGVCEHVKIGSREYIIKKSISSDGFDILSKGSNGMWHIDWSLSAHRGNAKRIQTVIRRLGGN